MFSELFGMGIETILFSFIADEEMYKVEDRFAEGELMTTIQKTAQAHKVLKAGTKVHQVQVSPSKVISIFQYYFFFYCTEFLMKKFNKLISYVYLAG